MKKSTTSQIVRAFPGPDPRGRRLQSWLFLAALAFLGALSAQAQLVINEVCAVNMNGAISPSGSTPDYIEIYNTTGAAVSLKDWTLSDNPDRPDKYAFPDNQSVPAFGRIVLWFDELPSPAYGTTNFTLKGSGEDLGLFYRDNLVDRVFFGPQLEDKPLCRVPDGTGPWKLGLPSPGAANSALSVTNFGSPLALRINEWLATNSLGSAFDWLELYNPSTNGIVDMSGVVITDAITNLPTPGLRPLSFIAAGDRLQFWCNDSTNDGDSLAIKLSSTSGETLSLYASNRATLIDRVSFGAQSSDVSMGRLPDGGSNIFYFIGTNNMTPGSANQWQSLTNIVVNEVLTHTAPPLEDAIELFNSTGSPIDISNWYLSDKEEFPLKFRIPAGTIIPAYGFKVFYEQNQANGSSATAGFNRSGTGLAPDFTLDQVHGTDVILTEGTAAGVTGRRNVKTVESSASGVSFGRHVKSDGGTDLVPMAARTFGSDTPTTVSQFRLGAGRTNSYPMVGPLVFTEFMYRPPDIGTNDNSIDEYVELRTTTNGLLRLYDPNYPTNVWRVRGGIEYDFPTNQSMAANTRIILVNFDPQTNAPQLAAFRSLYSVPTNVPVWGPYRGKLNNSKDTIEIQRPEAVQLPPKPDAGYVPRVIVERIKYEDDMDWNHLADGTGYSLQRLSLSGYANDHTNWYAAPTTAGAANAPGTAPVITSQPTSQITTQGFSAAFSVVVSGSAPFGYAWFHQGTILGAPSAATLTLTDVQPAQAGSFQVVITNYFGAVTSTVASLTVLQPPQITAQPITTALPAGAQATFSVTATGTAPLSYQWRRNSSPLSGQTSATLVLNNVQPANAGSYDVVISNAAGTVTSSPAALSIGGTAPTITLQPVSQAVPADSTVTLTVAATGSPALGYYWRFNGEPQPGANNASLVISHVHPLQSGQYDVIVSNAFGSVLSAPASVTIGQPPYILLPPTDQTVSAGDTVLLLIIADGTPTLSYQWRCNGTNLVGENSALIYLPNIQASQAGTYTVVISNDFGSITSEPVRVSVSGPPRLVMSTPAPDGAARLTLFGSAGLTYEVEASEVLSPPNWTLLRRFTLTNELGQELLLDESSTNLTKRFYRGKLVQ